MKIALLLGGQGRNLEYGYETHHEHFLKKYDVDVYCQLWWDEDIKKNGYIGNKANFKVQENLPDLIDELYKPKKLLIQKGYKTYTGDDYEKCEIFNDFPQFKDIPWSSKEHYLSQFLSVKNVSNLLNWDEYDFIIKSRYDIKLLSVPDLEKLDKNLFYPAQHSFGTLLEYEDLFCDIVFILPKTMKKFLHVMDGLEDEDIFSFGVFPEAIYGKWLQKLGFRDRLIKLPNEFVYL